MWIRTVNGLDFFEVAYTSQGIPYIIPKKKQLIKQSGGGMVDAQSVEVERYRGRTP